MSFIGFVGFSSQDFNTKKVKKIIDSIFENLDRKDVIVSGATNLGVPKLVYEKAKSLNMKTVGIMPEVGNDFDIFPVDELIIKGKDWGEESSEFLSSIEVLYKIGGGKQSEMEYKIAKEMNIECYEYTI